MVSASNLFSLCLILAAISTQAADVWTETKPMREGMLVCSTFPDSVIFDANATKCVAAFLDGQVLVRDLKSGNESMIVGDRFLDRQCEVLITKDGKRIIRAAGCDVEVWDAEKLSLVWVLTGHIAALNHMEMSPDETLLLTTSLDQTGILWSLEKGTQLSHLYSDSPYYPFDGGTFNATGALVVTTTNDPKAQVWDAATGKCLMVLKDCSCATFNPDGSLILISRGRLGSDLQNPRTGETQVHFKYFPRYTGFSNDGKRIKVEFHRGGIGLWDAESGAILVDSEAESNPVFSPDSRCLVSTNNDGAAIIRDTLDGKVVATLAGQKAAGAVEGCAFSPNGQLLACIYRDNTGKIWDLRSNEAVFAFSGDWYHTHAMFFTPDGTRLVALEDKSGPAPKVLALGSIDIADTKPGALHVAISRPDAVCLLESTKATDNKKLDRGILLNQRRKGLLQMDDEVVSVDGHSVPNGKAGSTAIDACLASLRKDARSFELEVFRKGGKRELVFHVSDPVKHEDAIIISKARVLDWISGFSSELEDSKKKAENYKGPHCSICAAFQKARREEPLSLGFVPQDELYRLAILHLTQGDRVSTIDGRGGVTFETLPETLKTLKMKIATKAAKNLQVEVFRSAYNQIILNYVLSETEDPQLPGEKEVDEHSAFVCLHALLLAEMMLENKMGRPTLPREVGPARDVVAGLEGAVISGYQLTLEKSNGALALLASPLRHDMSGTSLLRFLIADEGEIQFSVTKQ